MIKNTVKGILFVLFLFVSNCFNSVLAQAPAISYTTPNVYPVGTVITPLTPANAGGPVFIYGQTTTYAGDGSAGATNGPAATASFNIPLITAIDAAGNVYVADAANQLIRKISPAGIVSTLAGSGVAGNADGTGTAASFNHPGGLAIDATGNLYVADELNNLIRMVSPSGVVTTIAGNGSAGAVNGTGTAASFFNPCGIAIDGSGNVIVADFNNNRIRKVTPGGVVTTVAGTGAVGASNGPAASATFNSPISVALDAVGNIYVADRLNFTIREITSAGMVSTIAGSGAQAEVDGAGTSASFNYPNSITIDNRNNLYVADDLGNTVRRITPAGVVTTVAGNTMAGYVNGIGPAVEFNFAFGIISDGASYLYVADWGNSVIRRVVSAVYIISPTTLPPGLTFDEYTGIISGTPTTIWPTTIYTVTAYNPFGSSSTPVSITVVGAEVITFAPLVTTYGDADFDPGATSTITAIPITYTSSNPAVATIVNGKIHVVGVGTCTITASQAGTGTYVKATPVTKQLTVNPAVLTITANNQSRPYASANPPLTLTYSGFVNGDNMSILTAEPMVATSAIATSPVGNYPITVGGAGSANYTFSYVAGTLSITSVPITFGAISKKTVCDADFDAGASSDIPVTYSSSNTSVATIISGKVHITGAGTTVISVSNGSAQVTQQLTVNAAIIPAINISSSAPVAICQGTEVTFTATPANGGADPTYQWQVNGNNAGTNSNVFQSNTLANGDLIGCLLTNTDQGVCLTVPVATSNTLKITVDQNFTPTITITASSTAVCAGEPITFTAVANSASGNANYLWQVNGNNAGNNSPAFTTSDLNNNDVVTCSIGNNINCIIPATSNPVKVSVYPTLSVSFSGNVILNGNKGVQLQPVVTGGTVQSYSWQPATGLSNAAIANPVASPQVSTTYMLSVTSVNGCSATGIVKVILSGLLVIPNTFTPNGDGINDFWDISNLTYYPGCTVNIFSRWGSLVYHSIGYSKPWEGTYNGAPLPVGTYYYIIDIKNNAAPIAGYVTIIR